MPAVKDVGEPCAGEPHARFDGRAEETLQAQHNLHNKGFVPAWQSLMAQARRGALAARLRSTLLGVADWAGPVA